MNAKDEDFLKGTREATAGTHPVLDVFCQRAGTYYALVWWTNHRAGGRKTFSLIQFWEHRVGSYAYRNIVHSRSRGRCLWALLRHVLADLL
jgi:hypothetical protein